MVNNDFFSQVYYGNTVENWLISLLYLFGAIIIGRIMYWFSSRVLKKLTSKTDTKLDDILIDMLEEPLVCAIILWGLWVGIERLNLSVGIDKGMGVLYSILIVLNATWFAARIVNSLINEYLIPISEKETNKLDEHIISLIQKALGVLIWVFGGVMALNNAGVNVGALLAGLGIGGLAFALAAQDTVKNIFGGITLFTDKPFRIGDLVTVDGLTGTIEDIGLRSIRLRTLAGRLVTIPNYKTVEGNVENISKEPTRRVELKLGLVYGTKPEKMEQAMELLKEMPKTIKELDKTIQVYFSNYDDYALKITCYYFIKKSADILETQSIVNLEVLKQFNANKLQFAYPTHTIITQK